MGDNAVFGGGKDSGGNECLLSIPKRFSCWICSAHNFIRKGIYKSMKILIVDGDQTSAKLLDGYLKMYGECHIAKRDRN
jgi:hypothetical protein